MKPMFAPFAAALALILSVALSAAGWGHGLPGAAASSGSAELSAYFALGGSVGDLCGTASAPEDRSGDCPVCRIPGITLPLVDVSLARTMALATAVLRHGGQLLPVAERHPGWNERAPPGGLTVVPDGSGPDDFKRLKLQVHDLRCRERRLHRAPRLPGDAYDQTSHPCCRADARHRRRGT